MKLKKGQVVMLKPGGEANEGGQDFFWLFLLNKNYANRTKTEVKKSVVGFIVTGLPNAGRLPHATATLIDITMCIS